MPRSSCTAVLALGLIIAAVAAGCRADADPAAPAAAPPAASPPAGVEPWTRFCSQSDRGVPTDLPDFSWAGYARGEREPSTDGRAVFDVTAFGARPDDAEDDRAGIAAAVAAAGAAGGGVVFLPRGRYLVNTTMALRGMIPVSSSGIVIRGEGCGAGGTIIHCVLPFDRGDDPRDPRRMHLGDTVFTVAAPDAKAGIDAFPELAKVAGDARRGGLELAVDDAQAIRAGDWVLLWVRNQAVFHEMIAPFTVEPTWTSITEDKARIAEIHQVAAVRGATLVFAEPIRYPVQARHGWVVRRHNPISEIGFEDIAFLGSAHQRYAHHRSDLDDSGWSFIKMLGVANSWVRRCAFINSSQAVAVNLSAHVSLLNLVVDGNQGHHGLRSMWYNYGVLGGLCLDRAGCTHGPSVSLGSVGTVYWRCRQTPGQALDSHAGRPYCTLFDACVGGGLYGSTGGLRDFPQHLRDLVVWNLEHGAASSTAAPPHYDFWREGGSDRFVLPTIVGFHGAPATFAREHLAELVSPGTAVDPASLYEAQLARRLGGAPAWVAAAKREHDVVLATVLPEHFTLAAPDRGLHLLPRPGRVEELLRFLTTRSLAVNNSQQFTYTVSDPDLALNVDQNMLRDALYAVMTAIYAHSRAGNSIAAEETGTGVVFRLRSGALRSSRTAVDDETGVADARIFAAAIGAQLVVRSAAGRCEADLTVPR